MQKIIIYLEFILITAFLLLPPVFAKAAPQNITPQLSFFTIISLLTALYLYYRYEFNKNEMFFSSKLKFLIYSGKTLLILGSLFLFQAVFILVSVLTNNVIFPEYDFTLTFSGALKMIFIFLCAAFYEECLYRLYFPLVLNKAKAFFLSQKSKITENKFFISGINFFSEFIPVLVFSLAHKYMGLSGIVYAFISGSTLRFFAIKNKTVIPGFIAHFIYNVIIFALAVLR